MALSEPGPTDFAAVLRDCAPRVLALVYRKYGDFSAAEDAVQEALAQAVAVWPSKPPANPLAWLSAVATRRRIDALRGDSARRRREAAAYDPGPGEGPEPGDRGDDTLAMMFLCTHPALNTASSIALTLRAVGGLSTAEIAKAYFVSESTMAQRISRAKQAIQEAGRVFASPSARERAERLPAVLKVLYLIFNEGYLASGGPGLTRDDLSAEAIRLTRALHGDLPGEPEITGLLALLLLTHARRPARADARGGLVPLDRQDRSLWDRPLIGEGVALVTEALQRGMAGPYQIQAAIAAIHDEAPDFASTDWFQILALYDLLGRMEDNPMATLNQAIAAAMVYGPQKGLAVLESVAADPRLASTARVDSTRAHLLRMMGDPKAAAWYRSAAGKTASQAERDYLLLQAAEVFGETDVE